MSSTWTYLSAVSLYLLLSKPQIYRDCSNTPSSLGLIESPVLWTLIKCRHLLLQTFVKSLSFFLLLSSLVCQIEKPECDLIYGANSEKQVSPATAAYWPINLKEQTKYDMMCILNRCISSLALINFNLKKSFTSSRNIKAPAKKMADVPDICDGAFTMLSGCLFCSANKSWPCVSWRCHHVFLEWMASFSANLIKDFETYTKGQSNKHKLVMESKHTHSKRICALFTLFLMIACVAVIV